MVKIVDSMLFQMCSFISPAPKIKLIIQIKKKIQIVFQITGK